MPNTYLMAMDYAGINYDYNDNVYLVSNIKPENAERSVRARRRCPAAPSLVLDFDRVYTGTLPDKDGQAHGLHHHPAEPARHTPGVELVPPGAARHQHQRPGTLAINTFGDATTGSNAAPTIRWSTACG